MCQKVADKIWDSLKGPKSSETQTYNISNADQIWLLRYIEGFCRRIIYLLFFFYIQTVLFIRLISNWEIKYLNLYFFFINNNLG